MPHLAQHFDELLERLRPEFLAQMPRRLPHQPIRPRLPVRFCTPRKPVIGEPIEVNVTGQFVAGRSNLGHWPRLAVIHELKGMGALKINRSLHSHLLVVGRSGRTSKSLPLIAAPFNLSAASAKGGSLLSAEAAVLAFLKLPPPHVKWLPISAPTKHTSPSHPRSRWSETRRRALSRGRRQAPCRPHSGAWHPYSRAGRQSQRPKNAPRHRPRSHCPGTRSPVTFAPSQLSAIAACILQLGTTAGEHPAYLRTPKSALGPQPRNPFAGTRHQSPSRYRRKEPCRPHS